jgi:hypothetical protein
MASFVFDSGIVKSLGKDADHSAAYREGSLGHSAHQSGPVAAVD